MQPRYYFILMSTNIKSVLCVKLSYKKKKNKFFIFLNENYKYNIFHIVVAWCLGRSLTYTLIGWIHTRCSKSMVSEYVKSWFYALTAWIRYDGRFSEFVSVKLLKKNKKKKKTEDSAFFFIRICNECTLEVESFRRKTYISVHSTFYKYNKIIPEGHIIILYQQSVTRIDLIITITVLAAINYVKFTTHDVLERVFGNQNT